jgi:hypothetical protein
MSGSSGKLAGPHLLVRTLVLLTWAMFVVTILVTFSQHVFPISWALDVGGLIGFGLALAWFLLAGRWAYACLAASSVLLVLYIVRWILLIGYIHAGNPDLGLSVALDRLLELWFSEFSWNVRKVGLWQGVVVIYWNLAMAVIQIVVIISVFMLSRQRS